MAPSAMMKQAAHFIAHMNTRVSDCIPAPRPRVEVVHNCAVTSDLLFDRKDVTMWRGIVIGTCLTIVVAGAAAGQAQRPAATLDDLVGEVQAMRGEINRAAAASIRTQLLTARMTLQELRLSTA